MSLLLDGGGLSLRGLNGTETGDLGTGLVTGLGMGTSDLETRLRSGLVEEETELGGLGGGWGSLGRAGGRLAHLRDSALLPDLRTSISHPGQLHDSGTLQPTPYEGFMPAGYPGTESVPLGANMLHPGFQQPNPLPMQRRLELGGVAVPRTTSSFFSDHNIKRLLLSKDGRVGAGGVGSMSGNVSGVGGPRRTQGGLGMEVVGGRELPDSGGALCAFVGSVTKGGQLETLGEVAVGDEILEWNGTVLRGKTAEEVARVVANSTGEIEVLVRSGANLHLGTRQAANALTNNYAQPNHHTRNQNITSYDQTNHPHSSYTQGNKAHSSSYARTPVDPKQGTHQERSAGRTRRGVSGLGDEVPVRDPGWGAPPVPPHTSATGRHRPASPTSHGHRQDTVSVSHQPPPAIHIRPPTGFHDYDTVNSGCGSLRVAVSFDKATGTLFACVLAGRDLLRRQDAEESPPNPFVKIYLLPGRSVEKKRRTKYVRGTTAPEWNQTVVYKDLSWSELSQLWLELSVWDYNKAAHNSFLGQLILPLAEPGVVSGEPCWYGLEAGDERGREEGGPVRQASEEERMGPGEEMWVEEGPYAEPPPLPPHGSYPPPSAAFPPSQYQPSFAPVPQAPFHPAWDELPPQEIY